MASTYLTRAMGSVNEQQFTWSFWVKRAKLGVEQHLVGNYVNGSNRTHIFFDSTDTLRMYSELGGSVIIQYETNRKFRDTSAWSNIVIAINTTQAGGNRIRFYVNGEEETSFAQETECNQNTLLSIRATHYIGTYGGNAGNASYTFDGSMSHLHFVDGTQLTPSTFGSTDSTTGEWQINTSPSVTYGTNGFFILKDGNSVTDQSGNSNNFTVGGGTLTKSEDNPSNVFATLNPLVNNAGEMMLLTNGNTSCQSNAAQGNSWKLAVSTLGMTSGKYYWEIKFDNVHNCYNNGVMGSNILTANTSNPMNQIGYTGFYNIDGGEIRKDNVVTTQDYGTYATNDIMGVACDMDNHTITFYKNGSAFVSNVALSTTGRDVVFPCSVFYNTNNTGIPQASYNFGNGYFGTTAVSSAGTNASGIGIFEYDVPTGYTALSTKGLNL